MFWGLFYIKETLHMIHLCLYYRFFGISNTKVQALKGPLHWIQGNEHKWHFLEPVFDLSILGCCRIHVSTTWLTLWI